MRDALADVILTSIQVCGGNPLFVGERWGMRGGDVAVQRSANSVAEARISFVLCSYLYTQFMYTYMFIYFYALLDVCIVLSVEANKSCCAEGLMGEAPYTLPSTSSLHTPKNSQGLKPLHPYTSEPKERSNPA